MGVLHDMNVVYKMIQSSKGMNADECNRKKRLLKNIRMRSVLLVLPLFIHSCGECAIVSWMLMMHTSSMRIIESRLIRTEFAFVVASLE